MARPFYPRRPRNSSIEIQIEWFWKQTKATDSGCLEWQRALDSIGYGHVQWHGRSQRAHRCAWSFANGSIPEGIDVLHKCDNKICVNPEHLFLGTHLDNMRDKMAKGRHRVHRGQEHYRIALTQEQAEEIRILYKPGNGPQIARQFGISNTTVNRIVRHKSYI